MNEMSRRSLWLWLGLIVSILMDRALTPPEKLGSVCEGNPPFDPPSSASSSDCGMYTPPQV